MVTFYPQICAKWYWPSNAFQNLQNDKGIWPRMPRAMRHLRLKNPLNPFYHSIILPTQNGAIMQIWGIFSPVPSNLCFPQWKQLFETRMWFFDRCALSVVEPNFILDDQIICKTKCEWFELKFRTKYEFNDDFFNQK